MCKLCRTPFCYSNHRHTLQLSNASNYTCPRPEYPSEWNCISGIEIDMQRSHRDSEGRKAAHGWSGCDERRLKRTSGGEHVFLFLIVGSFNYSMSRVKRRKVFFCQLPETVNDFTRRCVCCHLLFCVIDSKWPRIRLRSRCFVSFAK